VGRSKGAVAALVCCALIGCSSDSSVQPDTAATSVPPSAEAVVDSTATGPAASGGESTDSGATIEGSANAEVPVWTDPTLPPTSTIVQSTAADDSLAQAVIDGLGYDVCELIEAGGVVGASLGGLDAEGVGVPRTMLELTSAYHHNGSTDDNEGAVSCQLAGVSTNGSDAPAMTLRVWTDQQLQLALSDPTATAAAHAPVFRERHWPADDPFNAPVELAGLGDGGWWVSGYEQSVFAWHGPFMASLVQSTSAELATKCEGDVETVRACQTDVIAPLITTFQGLFPLIDQTLMSGSGVPAILPPPRTDADVAMIGTAAGQADLCAAVTEAAAVVLPDGGFDPALAEAQGVTYNGLETKGGCSCTLNPIDREAGLTVEALAYGTNVADAVALYDLEQASAPPDPIAGLGEQAFRAFGQVHVLQNGVYVRMTVADYAQSGVLPYDQITAATLAMATDLIGRL
jgi:hypothetical protein